MKKSLMIVAGVAVCYVVFALGACIYSVVPSSKDQNALLHCSEATADVWEDVRGILFMDSNVDAHASFAREQELEDSCGIDLSEFSRGPYPVGIVCPEDPRWNGKSVRYYQEDHGDWHRAFVVRDTTTGIEVIACAGYI